MASIYVATLFLVMLALIAIALLQNTLDKLRVDITRMAINADLMANRSIVLRSGMQAVERELAGIRDNLENN